MSPVAIEEPLLVLALKLATVPTLPSAATEPITSSEMSSLPAVELQGIRRTGGCTGAATTRTGTGAGGRVGAGAAGVGAAAAAIGAAWASSCRAGRAGGRLGFGAAVTAATGRGADGRGRGCGGRSQFEAEHDPHSKRTVLSGPRSWTWFRAPQRLH
ncbi:MAG: hypothetical protein E6I85_09990 [Chloroflexi bacterium]|nr:MAG: hypothetical protein E6I85_09990 [Chloroflexota bacterium]